MADRLKGSNKTIDFGTHKKTSIEGIDPFVSQKKEVPK